MINTETLGPGTLNLGAAGTALAVSSQVRSFEVQPSENVTTKAAVPVLSGEQIAERNTVKHTAAIAATFLQDYSNGGIVEWSWEHRGTDQPFVFVPDTEGAARVTGVVTVTALNIGGAVQLSDEADPLESSVTWRCPTFPAFTPNA